MVVKLKCRSWCRYWGAGRREGVRGESEGLAGGTWGFRKQERVGGYVGIDEERVTGRWEWEGAVRV